MLLQDTPKFLKVPNNNFQSKERPCFPQALNHEEGR